MFDFEYLYLDRIHLLWPIFGVFALILWWDTHTRRRLSAFISLTMQARLVQRPHRLARMVFHTLVAVALVFGTLALMRPQTRTTQTTRVYKKAADIIVVLDVSRSMLAADTTPSRLERARADLRDMLPALEGHRLGLIAFAGRAEPLCALTLDHSYFQQTLELANDLSVSRGGTRIGDALRAAIAAFPEPERDATGNTQSSTSRVVVLLTDGEDHESNPVAAADAAKAAGVSVIAIGFGDEAGSEISVMNPTTGAREVVKDRDGNVVRTRLDGATLREIAQRTGGIYIPAGTAVLDLNEIVQRHVTPLISAAEEMGERDILEVRCSGGA